MKLADKIMGFEVPGDQKVSVPGRDWNAMKLALWRSRAAWEIAAREAAEILDRCRHVDGCPGEEDETEPCPGPTVTFSEEGGISTQVLGPVCPDRELRMSALVILNAARQLAPTIARRPADTAYYAPSREYFSEVLAELATTQTENAMLREALRAAGVEPPSPPTNPDQILPTRPPVQLPQFEETT
jgi:hypothetical protein